MIGFPIGAWTSERFGRVPTVAYFGGAGWLGALAFYWGPGALTYPFLWLAVAYCWFKVASAVMTVGANAAATELFPAALRSTMVGWQMITGAVFSVVAQTAIAALIGPLGGLTMVDSLLLVARISERNYLWPLPRRDPRAAAGGSGERTAMG